MRQRLVLHPHSEPVLVAAAAQNEPEARDRLVESFMPLIVSTARPYRDSPRVNLAELIQEGVVGLLRALERFEPQRGTPFWAYASWWVRQAMQQLVSEMTHQVVLSDRALRRLSRIKDARQAYTRAHAREPTRSELAAASGCTREQVASLLAAERIPKGLHEPVGVDERGGTLGELIADPAGEDDYGAVAQRAHVGNLRGHFMHLSARERLVVDAHYALSGNAKTLLEIAKQLGLSVERVRQIEEHALEKLREAFEHPELRPVPPGGSPGAFRERLAHELATANVEGLRALGMLIAAHETATGAWRHGAAPERLSVGTEADRFVCEISYRRDDVEHPVSAWMARQLTWRWERFEYANRETVRLWV